ncbi:methyltransferase, FkbM family [Algoriphagus faecimaris]|uniref:Methyltransferase, FkbM family n=1 Tax=Algoriphagus faecimaris TaxID=686796 RepID=A0A1G6UDP1_9BACT|nr:methyltransferase, FkbM family [Algoriphagus faecimaris]
MAATLAYFAKFLSAIPELGLVNTFKLFFLVRIFAKEFLLEFKRNNIKLSVYLRGRTSDSDIFRTIFINEEYKLPKKHKPKFILDAGANIGMSALFFYFLYPDAIIIALEPDKNIFKQLIKNTRGFERIYPTNAALWKNAGLIQFNSEKSTLGGSVKISDQNDETFMDVELTIESLTIEKLKEKYNIPYFDFLKIDIEGAELEVFNEDIDLSATNMIAIELHDHKKSGCGEAFFQACSSQKFNYAVSGENIIAYK